MFAGETKIVAERVGGTEVFAAPWAHHQRFNYVRGILDPTVEIIDIVDHNYKFHAVATGSVFGKSFKVSLVVDGVRTGPEADDGLAHLHDQVAFVSFWRMLPHDFKSQFAVILFNRTEVRNM